LQGNIGLKNNQSNYDTSETENHEPQHDICTTRSQPSRIITLKPACVTTKDVNNNNHHTHAKVNQSIQPKPLKSNIDRTN